MRYQSIADCVDDLEKTSQLLRIKEEVDPHLQMAEIHRRVYQAEGPAILYERVKGSPFPAVSNLFGTLDRCHFLFRSTFRAVQQLIRIKADPSVCWRHPLETMEIFKVLFQIPPLPSNNGPCLQRTTSITQLPQVQCWPDDGGPFVLLPQVYSEDPKQPGLIKSNMGMYRVQLGGNDYIPDEEIGLHYQIRRDIGIHHTHALEQGEELKVSIFVGGPPAHSLAAVMPLPEGLPEFAFAGALSGRNFRYARRDGFTISADADFCIVGTITADTKPEGPFGDHLGYYSLTHDFPVLRVKQVYHRPNAIWPFTVVGRPPQEDTSFGHMIHELTGPMVPVSLPGVRSIHAVDATGVHPLLLAIGSERYVPYQPREPQELLTLANAILGFGHCSLAKYLLIIAGEDNPQLDIHDLPGFFMHLLERVDWRRDLHFQTKTTIDTLDYSGTGVNQGSKVVIAAAGEPKRTLSKELPATLNLPAGFRNPALLLPGVIAIEGPEYQGDKDAHKDLEKLEEGLRGSIDVQQHPLVILLDDSDFAARHLSNWLWVTFTRSNPSHDIYGVDTFIDHKHWGCRGSLIIDARLKPHHAPPLLEDPKITESVDALAAPGKPLHGVI